MTCKEHSGFIATLKSIEEKLDNQLEHCYLTTNCTNDKFNKIEINVASLNSKVDWLVLDRQEQRQRYDKKNLWKRNTYYGIATVLLGFFSYLFKEREAVRLIIKEWLGS